MWHELGAEELAAYEFHMTSERPRKADRQAAKADDGDASELASISEGHANEASVCRHPQRSIDVFSSCALKDCGKLVSPPDPSR